MPYATLLHEVRGSVATIALNRPDAANSLNAEMTMDLLRAVMETDANPEVRALVITGTGSVFCSGGDLRSFRAAGARLPQHVRDMTVYLHAAVSRLARMDAPVIAAVNGAAAGAGLALACACDIVLAGESARFAMAYTRVGLTPDGSSTYSLPRIVGMRRALELTLTNRVLSAKEALDWGIVTRVVPDGQLAAEAQGLAVQLAAGPTRSFGAAKRLLHRGWTETLEGQMENESQSISNAARTADVNEGIAAFLEKRPPQFKGQ